MWHLHCIANTLYMAGSVWWLWSEYCSNTSAQQMTNWKLKKKQLDTIKKKTFFNLSSYLFLMHENCHVARFVQFVLKALIWAVLFYLNLFFRRHIEKQVLDPHRPDERVHLQVEYKKKCLINFPSKKCSFLSVTLRQCVHHGNIWYIYVINTNTLS